MIRCVHCGASLVTEPAAVTAGAPAEPAVLDAPPQGPVAAPQADAPGPPTRDPWVTPSTRSGDRDPVQIPPPSRAPDAPRPAGWRADGVLILGAVIAVAGAVAAYSSLALPWVQARLTTIGDRLEPETVADLTFRSSDAFAGTVVIGVAAALLTLGLQWFWYGLDRGARLPAHAHPLLALLAAAAGVVVLVLGRLGHLVWDVAFVTHAREAGMTKGAMRELLAARPAPDISIELRGGVYRFAVAVTLALIAGIVAWWSQGRRSWS